MADFHSAEPLRQAIGSAIGQRCLNAAIPAALQSYLMWEIVAVDLQRLVDLSILTQHDFIYYFFMPHAA